MTPILLVLALAAVLGDSAAAVREPLSLENALARAGAHNPELRALRDRADASAARGQTILKQRLPRLGVEVNAQRTDNPAAVFAHKLDSGRFTTEDFDIARLSSPGALSHLGSSLYVEIPIDLFGRISLASGAQAAAQKAFTENMREAEATVALQVVEAYLGAVLAGRAALATEKAVVAARSREASTQARFAEGAALQSDLLRVRARRRAREADLASQHAGLEVAKAMLGRLMGAPNGAAFDLTDTVRPGASLEPLEEWQARAARARPTLLVTQARREAAALTVRLEAKASRPEVAAQARLMDNRTPHGGGQSWALGATLRWNFYDAARGNRLAAAAADERAAIEDEHAARDGVRFEVEAAYSRLHAAKVRLEAAAGGADEGREALRVIQERHAQGLATLTDELETEAAAFAAELEEIDAARSAVLAEAALRRAAGVNPGSTMP